MKWCSHGADRGVQLLGPTALSVDGRFVELGTAQRRRLLAALALAVGTVDGPVGFGTDPAQWREIACGIVHRELTPDEWRTFVSDIGPG